MANVAHDTSTRPRAYRRDRSRPVQESHDDVAVVPAVISITGQDFHAGYRVNVDARRCCVNPSPFDYLLELTLALYRSPKRPHLRWSDTRCTQRDPNLTRQVAKRLRAQLENKSLVHNNKKGGYCLAVDPAHVFLCDTLWELPPQLVARDVLVALKAAHDHFWMWRSAQESVAVDRSSDIVAPPSRSETLNRLKIDATLDNNAWSDRGTSP